MTRPQLTLVLLVISTGAACATNAPLYEARAPTGEPIVAVRHFAMNLYPPEYAGPTQFGVMMAEYIAGSLQEQGVAAITVKRGEKAPLGTDFEIRGELLYLDPGSWNRRFWSRFGAGGALVTVRAEIVQGDGEPLEQTKQRARSNTWQGAENILRRACARVARAVAIDLGKEIGLRRRRAG